MDESNPFDPKKQPQIVFKAQLSFCTVTGTLIFLFFCLMRYKLPLLYSIRSYRKYHIRKLPHNVFGWMSVLYKINENDILEVAGLDAFVFLSFFKMCIKILFTFSLFAVLIISPLRYLFTGHYDKDSMTISKGSKHEGNPMYERYMWLCFAYVFTGLVLYFLFKQTEMVIKTRQRYLGSQNSITDRTIRISNIPKSLTNPEGLKEFIESLGIGSVEKATIVCDYKPLRKLFEKRSKVLQKLEMAYSDLYGLKINILTQYDVPSTSIDLPSRSRKSEMCLTSVDSAEGVVPELTPVLPSHPKSKRPMKKVGFNKRVDLFNFYAASLLRIDEKINQLKQNNSFKPIQHALVTMTSVADAQMAAQAVFSPNIFQMITHLAPAPNDVNWDNINLSSRTRIIRRNVIELMIFVFSAFLVFPISSIANLLNVQTIQKFVPKFGEYLLDHKWVAYAVTGLLPTYLFTLINVGLPYFISYLTRQQGFISKGDMELSILRKNFWYIFFNLFLFFTLFGTLSNYWSLLNDTTKIAYLLAGSIKKLSLFYIDLILLQGLTMFPFKLLQIGDLATIFWKYGICFSWTTPRDYRTLIYKPAVFDFGFILPQHLLIFIITLIYSVISTKIVVSGLMYFVLGFYTYKYQLVYSMVHLQHSTGKSWPIIFRRVCLGLFFLQLTMSSTLALEGAFVLSGCIVPLFGTTLAALFSFEKNYLPLLNYIALDSIKHPSNQIYQDDEPEEQVNILPAGTNALRRKKSTFDEEREESQKYIYPLLLDPMDGPCIGFSGELVDTVRYKKEVNPDGQVFILSDVRRKEWIQDEYN